MASQTIILKAITQGFDSMNKQIGGLKSSMMGAAAVTGAVVLGFKAVGAAASWMYGQVMAQVQAAKLYVQTYAQLKDQLAQLTPEYKAVAQSAVKFAEEQQMLTGLSIDQIVAQQKLAVQMGFNEKQMGRAAMAMLTLEKAFGMGGATGARALGETLSGNTRLLGRMIPAIKNLSKEQLQNGAAVDFLLKRYGGMLNAGLQTTAGQLDLVSQIWGDRYTEAIATAFFESGKMAAILGQINKLLADNAPSAQTLSDLVLMLARGFLVFSGQVASATNKVIIPALQAFNSFMVRVFEALPKTIFQPFYYGLKLLVEDVLPKLPGIPDAVRDSANSVYSVLDTMVNGIGRFGDKVNNALSVVGDAAYATEKISDNMIAAFDAAKNDSDVKATANRAGEEYGKQVAKGAKKKFVEIWTEKDSMKLGLDVSKDIERWQNDLGKAYEKIDKTIYELENERNKKLWAGVQELISSATAEQFSDLAAMAQQYGVSDTELHQAMLERRKELDAQYMEEVKARNADTFGFIGGQLNFLASSSLDMFEGMISGTKKFKKSAIDMGYAVAKNTFQWAVGNIINNALAAATGAAESASKIPYVGWILAAVAAAGVFAALAVYKNKAKAPKKMAMGGIVTGGIPGVDSVPIMGMPGEKVIRPMEAERDQASPRQSNVTINVQTSGLPVQSKVDNQRWTRDNLLPALKDLQRSGNLAFLGAR